MFRNIEGFIQYQLWKLWNDIEAKRVELDDLEANRVELDDLSTLTPWKPKRIQSFCQ